MFRTHQIAQAPRKAAAKQRLPVLSRVLAAGFSTLIATAPAPGQPPPAATPNSAQAPGSEAPTQDRTLDLARLATGPSAESAAATADARASTSVAEALPRWISEVQAQRHALAERRRAYHESRLRLHEQALSAQTAFHQSQRQRVIDHLDTQRRDLLENRHQMLPFSPPHPLLGAHPSAPNPAGNPGSPLAPWLGGPWNRQASDAKRPIRMPAGAPPTSSANLPSGMPSVASSAPRESTVEPTAAEEAKPDAQAAQPASAAVLPAEWDNRWYYRGW